MQLFGLAGIFLVEPHERVAVGFAKANVVVLVDGLPFQSRVSFLPLSVMSYDCHCAGRLREILTGISALIKGSAIVKAELWLAETVEDLDLKKPAIVHAGVASLGTVNSRWSW